MRVVGGVALGFLGATIVTGGLSFVGFNDPGMIGLLHIVLWLVFTIRFVKRQPKTVGVDPRSTSPPNDDAEVLEDQVLPPGRGSPAGPFKTEPTAATATEPSVAEHESRTRKGSWLKKAAVLVSFFLVLGVVALSGFLGAKYAIDQAAATTTTLDTLDMDSTDPEGWSDLTNAEQAWCKRDSDTWFTMLRAAEILGFHSFSTNLIAVREGRADVYDDIQNDLNRWSIEKGGDGRDRQIAIACRAAFSGR